MQGCFDFWLAVSIGKAVQEAATRLGSKQKAEASKGQRSRMPELVVELSRISTAWERRMAASFRFPGSPSFRVIKYAYI